MDLVLTKDIREYSGWEKTVIMPLDIVNNDISMNNLWDKTVVLPSAIFNDEITTKSTTFLGYAQNEIIIEVPANLAGGIVGCESFGAYSYFGDGFVARFVKSIGRFAIIGEKVTLGTYHHCVNAISAHPMFYWNKGRFSKFHNITNEDICRVNIIHHNKFSKMLLRGKMIIGNDVWIGNNVMVLNGVHVGDGAVIGAGAIVTKDVPPYSIVAGNPARVIRYRFSEEQIKALLSICWWDYGPEILDGIFLGDIDDAIGIIKERIANGFEKVKYPFYKIKFKDMTLEKFG